MKKIYIISFVINILLSLSSFGQVQKRVIDRQNCRDGESVEYCHSHKKLQELFNDPIEKQKYIAYQIEQDQLSNIGNSKSTEKLFVYQIPIVFHVLHNGGSENISREQILDGLAIMNRDFRKLNADAATVVSEFQGLPADIEVQFVLATKDPLGNCFSGITRTQNIITNDGTDGDLQVDAIIAGNDVYNGIWPGDMYLNVFICAEIGGAAGYTRQPYSSEMYNGIWVLSDYVGSIGTSSENTSRTLTHESGHWLNLAHVWGNTNNPGVACGNDNVNDTPITKGYTSCSLSNSKICNSTIVENVENYMDYSYCSKMFTNGQKTRMRNALISANGGRSNLWTTNNLIATGATGTNSLCKTDFTVNKRVICSGESVTFQDLSYNVATAWSWITTGGIPATSISQNPTVVYNTPGFYTVTLNASGNGASDSETKTQLIQVLPAASTFPFFESFENYSSLTSTNSWSVNDLNGINPFTLYSGTGYSSQKCVKLSNFDETTVTVDELVSPNIDLSSLTDQDTIVLSFRYSYKRKIASNNESLKILASADCGDSWVIKSTYLGSGLVGSANTIPWTPSVNSDWTTVHDPSISKSFYTSNFRFKFQFNGNGGNNIYIDDINLLKQESLGLSKNESNFEALEIYPNPSAGELNVHFSTPKDENAVIKIQDILGKVAQSQSIKAIEGSNLVLLNTENLASGMYFLNIQMGTSQKIMQFVVK